MNDAFSLDLFPPDGAVLSGCNFREVAPELLSPMSWSVVAAGMERGFRTIADRLGATVPGGRPAFLAYVAFRPYHVISEVHRLHPLIPWADLWRLFLGGDPPAAVIADQPRPSLPTLVSGGRGLARVWFETDTATAALAEEVAALEHRVRLLGAGNALQLGRLVDDAVGIGRRAWRAHVLATGRALAAASLLRRTLEVRDDPASVAEIIHAVAHRLDEARQPSARPGRLPASLAVLSSYELAVETDRFARWSRRPSLVPALPVPAELASAGHPVLLTDTVVGRAARRLVASLDQALEGREQTKNLGLRALHALRLVLAADGMPHPLADAVLLGPEELLDGGECDRGALIETRKRELEVAAQLELPVDARVRGGRLTALARRSPAAGAGVPLAPGWARGPLVTEDDAEPGAVLFGRTVEGNLVIATRPAAVVAELASTLSHVAVVCRELQIPLVTGIRLRTEDAGREAVVDGWSGEVTLDPR